MSALHGLSLASIPSPSSSTLELGPFSIHFYGLTLLVAIVAAVVITGIRWTRRGGDWDLIFRLAVWGVAFGIVGARLYHVDHELGRAARRVVGAVRDLEGRPRRLGRDRPRRASSARSSRSGPARACRRSRTASRPRFSSRRGSGASGTGGTRSSSASPTDLPWGLEISPDNRPIDVHRERDVPPDVPLRGALVLRRGGRSCCSSSGRFKLRPGNLFALYVFIYSIGRLWIETLRDRPLARDRRRAAERLGRRARDRRLGRVLRLVAADVEARRRGQAPPPKTETMADSEGARPAVGTSAQG